MKPALATLAAIVVLLAPAAAAARQTEVSGIDLLDYYSLGQYRTVATALASGARGDLIVIYDSLRKDADEWIASDGPGESPRRRRIVAMLALETAAAGLDTQWVRSLQILEWGCDLLRREPSADGFERDWHLAALAIIEGARDTSALEIHMAHMRARVPGEPRLLLARAFVTETAYWDDNWAHANWRVSNQQAGGNQSSSGAPLGFLLGGNPDPVAKQLKAAESKVENRREVALRLGYLAMVGNHAEQALAHFSEVGAGDDPGQVYLSHLFGAWMYERLGQSAGAVGAYRAALAAVPNAQAAAVGLAAHLSAAGEREEAASLVRAAVEAGTAAMDPWRAYGYGDWRRLPLLLETLRRELR